MALLKDLDKKYKTDNSARLELSFLMIMKGFIYSNNNEHQLNLDKLTCKKYGFGRKIQKKSKFR